MAAPAPAPLAPCLPRPRKLAGTPRPFAKKPRPYLAVLREAELHPEAPAHHRRAQQVMQLEAVRADAIDAEVIETRALPSEVTL